MTGTFTVATYNIHGFTTFNGAYRPARTVAEILRLDADIIALQEVDADDRDGITILANHCHDRGYRLTLGPTIMEANGRHYGNMLLTRGELIDHRRHDLSEPGREPRGAIEAIVRLHGETWRVLATHLGLNPKERRRQIRYLLTELERDPTVNTLLMGDLNEWFLWGRPQRWLKRHFRLSHHPATFPSRMPVFALDRIWVHPHDRVKRIDRVCTRETRSVSDHLPLVGEILKR